MIPWPPAPSCAASAIYDVPMPERGTIAPADSFLESLMDTELYSIGRVLLRRASGPRRGGRDAEREIERRGLAHLLRAGDAPIEESFETLLTGLAVRYYKAVAG